MDISEKSWRTVRIAVLPIAAVATVIVLLAAAAFSAEEQSGYSFSNVTVASYDPSAKEAEVGFDAQWTSATFPGVYECTWRVFDANGNTVGEYSDVLYGLQRSGKLAVPVPAPVEPVTAEAGCDSTRLDVGGEYTYDVTDVELSAGDEPTLSFDAVWRGTGQPGVVSCRLSITTPSGNVVETRPLNLVFAEGLVNDHAVELVFDNGAPNATTLSASVGSCQPFTT